MYLLGNPTTIDWVLGVTPNTLLFSDLNLVIIDPLGTSTFLTSPIAEADFTAPTEFVEGAASYVITPNLEGFWRIRLVTGTADSYKILSKVEMQVFDNVSVINPYSPEIGKPIPYDLSYYMQGYMVPSEMVGQISVNRDIVLAENDVRNKAYADVAPTVEEQVFLISHNGVQIGTITFALNSKVGVVLISYRLLAAGEVVSISVAPGVIDYAIKDVSVTLTGCSEVSACSIL